MIDPTGRLITFIAADPGVSGFPSPVTGQKKNVVGDDGKVVPIPAPFVLVQRRSSTDAIAGPGTDRGPAMVIDFVALCYGEKKQSGERDAFRLAGAVHDAVHLKGPVTFPVPGGGSGHVGVYRMRAASIGGVLIDPVTQQPYVPVFFNVIASGQPLT